jgi:hypothetical protein
MSVSTPASPATPPKRPRSDVTDPISAELEQYARLFYHQLAMWHCADPAVVDAPARMREAVSEDFNDRLNDLVLLVDKHFTVPQCVFKAAEDARRRVLRDYRARMSEVNTGCIMCGSWDIAPDRESACGPCMEVYTEHRVFSKIPRCEECGFVHTWASDSVYGPDLVALAGAVFSRSCETLSRLGHWFLSEAISVFANSYAVDEDVLTTARQLGHHFASDRGPLDRRRESERSERIALPPPIKGSPSDRKCRVLLTMISYPEYFPLCFADNMPMCAWSGRQVRRRVSDQ